MGRNRKSRFKEASRTPVENTLVPKNVAVLQQNSGYSSSTPSDGNSVEGDLMNEVDDKGIDLLSKPGRKKAEGVLTLSDDGLFKDPVGQALTPTNLSDDEVTCTQGLRSRIHSKRKKARKRAIRSVKMNSDGSNLSASSGTSNSAVHKINGSLNNKARTLLMPGSGKPKQTIREILASIPGFKPRRRPARKLSTAAQIRQTKEGCIDLETPDSILVNINPRELINKHTFAQLPAHYQYRLLQLLPKCDRVYGPDGALRLGPTSLNNEFFAKACLEWRERLAQGEFTQENQMRLKQEEEKEQSKLDTWKLQYFEPVWGQKSVTDPVASDPSTLMNTPVLRASLNKPAEPVTFKSSRLSANFARENSGHATRMQSMMNAAQASSTVTSEDVKKSATSAVKPPTSAAKPMNSLASLMTMAPEDIPHGSQNAKTLR